MKPNRSQPTRQPRANRHAAEASGPLPQLGEDDLYDLVIASENPLLLLLDEVTDPHNLGACLRSANAAGALAIVTPKHHSAGVTDTVVRVSCGAAAATPVVQVTNLARALKKLQELGVWLVGTDDSATRTIHELDLRGPLGLVMGAEGSGMRRLTREGCDFLAKIPMHGTVPCLNVSVAAGVCLFEAVRQRTLPQS